MTCAVNATCLPLNRFGSLQRVQSEMHLKHTNQLKDPKMGAAVVKQYFKICKNLCSHRIMSPGASEGNDEGKSVS